MWAQILRGRGRRPQHIYTPIDREWFSYNFAAETFPFTQRNFVAEFIRFKLFFDPPFGGLRGNVRTPSIARWKARGRLSIRDNWTFLASSYGWDVISRYLSKSALIRGSGSLWAQILGGRGRRPPTIVGTTKLVFLLHHGEDRVILSSFVWIGYRSVTDRETDGRAIAILRSALQVMRPRSKYKNLQLFHRHGQFYYLTTQKTPLIEISQMHCACFKFYIQSKIFE